MINLSRRPAPSWDTVLDLVQVVGESRMMDKTRQINAGAAVRQFSADGDSHSAKHLCLKDEPL